VVCFSLATLRSKATADNTTHIVISTFNLIVGRSGGHVENACQWILDHPEAGQEAPAAVAVRYNTVQRNTPILTSVGCCLGWWRRGRLRRWYPLPVLLVRVTDDYPAPHVHMANCDRCKKQIVGTRYKVHSPSSLVCSPRNSPPRPRSARSVPTLTCALPVIPCESCGTVSSFPCLPSWWFGIGGTLDHTLSCVESHLIAFLLLTLCH
jgi:hypothetical protein